MVFTVWYDGSHKKWFSATCINAKLVLWQSQFTVYYRRAWWHWSYRKIHCRFKWTDNLKKNQVIAETLLTFFLNATSVPNVINGVNHQWAKWRLKSVSHFARNFLIPSPIAFGPAAFRTKFTFSLYQSQNSNINFITTHMNLMPSLAFSERRSPQFLFSFVSYNLFCDNNSIFTNYVPRYPVYIAASRRII